MFSKKKKGSKTQTENSVDFNTVVAEMKEMFKARQRREGGSENVGEEGEASTSQSRSRPTNLAGDGSTSPVIGAEAAPTLQNTGMAYPLWRDLQNAHENVTEALNRVSECRRVVGGQRIDDYPTAPPRTVEPQDFRGGEDRGAVLSQSGWGGAETIQTLGKDEVCEEEGGLFENGRRGPPRENVDPCLIQSAQNMLAQGEQIVQNLENIFTNVQGGPISVTASEEREKRNFLNSERIKVHFKNAAARNAEGGMGERRMGSTGHFPRGEQRFDNEPMRGNSLGDTGGSAGDGTQDRQDSIPRRPEYTFVGGRGEGSIGSLGSYSSFPQHQGGGRILSSTARVSERAPTGDWGDGARPEPEEQRLGGRWEQGRTYIVADGTPSDSETLRGRGFTDSRTPRTNFECPHSRACRGRVQCEARLMAETRVLGEGFEAVYDECPHRRACQGRVQCETRLTTEARALREGLGENIRVDEGSTGLSFRDTVPPRSNSPWGDPPPYQPQRTEESHRADRFDLPRPDINSSPRFQSTRDYPAVERDVYTNSRENDQLPQRRHRRPSCPSRGVEGIPMIEGGAIDTSTFRRHGSMRERTGQSRTSQGNYEGVERAENYALTRGGEGSLRGRVREGESFRRSSLHRESGGRRQGRGERLPERYPSRSPSSSPPPPYRRNARPHGRRSSPSPPSSPSPTPRRDVRPYRRRRPSADEEEEDDFIPPQTISALKMKNLKSFLGRPRSDRKLSDFLRELEAAMKLYVPASIRNRPEKYDRVRALILQIYLGEEALAFYSGLDEGVQNSYTLSVRAIRERFGEKLTKRVIMEKLKNIKQGGGQTVAALKADIVHWVSLYMKEEEEVGRGGTREREANRDLLCRDYFMEGLKADLHNEVQAKIQGGENFEELVELALAAETLFNKCKVTDEGYHRGGRVHRVMEMREGEDKNKNSAPRNENRSPASTTGPRPPGAPQSNYPRSYSRPGPRPEPRYPQPQPRVTNFPPMPYNMRPINFDPNRPRYTSPSQPPYPMTGPPRWPYRPAFWSSAHGIMRPPGQPGPGPARF